MFCLYLYIVAIWWKEKEMKTVSQQQITSAHQPAPPSLSVKDRQISQHQPQGDYLTWSDKFLAGGGEGSGIRVHFQMFSK